MAIALKGRDQVALGVTCTLGERPHIFAHQILGIGQLDIEFHVHIVDDNRCRTLLNHAQQGSDVVDEQRIGATAHAVNRQSHLIDAGLVILVRRVHFGRSRSVAEVPLHLSRLGRSIGEQDCRYHIKVQTVEVVIHSIGEVHVLGGKIVIAGRLVNTRHRHYRHQYQK